MCGPVILALALTLAAQWTDSGPEQQTPDGVTITGSESAHLKLGAWGAAGGLVERTSPGYLAFVAKNPAYSAAASFYFMDEGYRVTAPVWAAIAQPSPSSGFLTYASLRWDGTLFLHHGIVTGPGSGSGNIALDCAPTEGMCYIAIAAHLPGGEQSPPRVHGALTVSNEAEMGPGSYMLQLRHGATKNALLVGGDDPGNIWSSGNLLRLEGLHGKISTREGMFLDPGVGSVTVQGSSGLIMEDPDATMQGHVIERLPLADPDDGRLPQVGDAETWLDAGAQVLHLKVRVALGPDGIRDVALPLGAP